MVLVVTLFAEVNFLRETVHIALLIVTLLTFDDLGILVLLLMECEMNQVVRKRL